MTTSEVEITELKTDDEWSEALPILKQLWSDAEDDFILSWRDEDDYRLFGMYVEDELVGVAGVSVQRVLHHVRHAWIHDFVIDERYRSKGYGSELLSFVEEWAEEQDCEYVDLANRLENESAVEFYDENGMAKWGYVLEKEL